jgi:hypothetical protein
MKEVAWIKSQDSASVEPAAQLHVADSVMRQVRQSATEQTGRDPFGIAALIATLAGGGAVACAFIGWSAFQDSLVNLFDSVKLVLQ